MYKFYLGEILLPVAPSIRLKLIRNKNVDLINDTEINILKQAGLVNLIQFLIPQVAGYPFVDNIYKELPII